MSTGVDALTRRQREAYADLKARGKLWLVPGYTYAPRTLAALVAAGVAAWAGDDFNSYIVGPDSICGTCGREWHSQSLPTPAGRCPWEHEHDDEPRQAVSVSTFRGDDGATVVQIDTDDEMAGRLRVNVNDGPAVADFDPATQDSEAERAGRARDVLAAHVPWLDSPEYAEAAERARRARDVLAADRGYKAERALYLDKAERAIRNALAVLS